MTLPHFLIIGAMKAGTTTFYHDLLSHPGIFMPADKEPHALTRDAVLTDEGRAAYAALFEPATPGQKCGEASTGYTKLPDYPGVPRRAKAVLGPGVKLIYLMREPVARIISHNHHRFTAGIFKQGDIARNLRKHPELLNWSRYAMQARAWIDEFGRDALLLIRFEDYVSDRRAWIARAQRFLGVEPRPDLVNVDVYYNQSEGKPVMTDAWRAVRKYTGYRRFLRPLLPSSIKQRLRSMVLPKAPPRPDPPNAETVAWIIDQLREDLADLRQLMGLDAPVWDMNAVAAKATRERQEPA